MSPVRRRGRHSLAALSMLCGALCVDPTLAHGSELPGAHLHVRRTEAASDCSDEEEIAAQLRSRLRQSPSKEPLWIDVLFDAETPGTRTDGTSAGATSAREFSAQVKVRGGRQGERTLRAAGPGCDNLREALLVSLLLVLDPDADGPALGSASPERTAHAPEAPAESPAPAAPAAPAAPERAGALSGWASAGLALTHGLPEGFSFSIFGDFAFRFEGGELSLGAFWAPERSVSFEPGTVALNVWGARLRGCFRLWERPGDVRFSGCGFGIGARLRGEGIGYTNDQAQVRPWWLLGAGPDLRWFPVDRLGVGLTAGALATLHREAFTVLIGGADERSVRAFRTNHVVAWLGADVGVQIW